MHRVYVAWDTDDAKRFLGFLETHGIRGRIIEDKEYPARGEMHDVEASPEVWISEEALVAQALDLASKFEVQRGTRPPREADA
jgi:hypothetical protein